MSASTAIASATKMSVNGNGNGTGPSAPIKRQRSMSSELSDVPAVKPKPTTNGKSKLPLGDPKAYTIPTSTTSTSAVASSSTSKPKVKKVSAAGTSKKAAVGKDGAGSKPKVKKDSGWDANKMVQRRRVFWARPDESKVEYDIEPPIKDDWQVAYVWAFLVKFHRDNIKDEASKQAKESRMGELGTVDEFELALKSQVPNDGLEEVLKILLRPLLDTEQTEGVNKKAKRVPLNNDNLRTELEKYIDRQLLPEKPLTLFDAYSFSKVEFFPTETEAQSADKLYDEDASKTEWRKVQQTDKSDDRRHHNPMRIHDGFWGTSWEVKVKVLRQLVDWNLLDPATKDVISDLYPRHGRRKKTEVDIFASEKGPSGYHYQLVDSSWRVYGIGKPFVMSSHTVTIASTKDEYLTLKSKLLDDRKKLESYEKKKIMATTQKDKQKLGNTIQMLKRDVDFGLEMERRIPDIEAHLEKLELEKQEAEKKKIRQKERAAREAQRVARMPVLPSYVGPRMTRSRAVVNYNEDANQADIEDDDDPEIEYIGRDKRSKSNSDSEDGPPRKRTRYEKDGEFRSGSAEPMEEDDDDDDQDDPIALAMPNKRATRNSAMTEGFSETGRNTRSRARQSVNSSRDSSVLQGDEEEEEEEANGGEEDVEMDEDGDAEMTGSGDDDIQVISDPGMDED